MRRNPIRNRIFRPLALALSAMIGLGAPAPLSAACSATAIAGQDAVFTVPFEIVHGRVYVMARVNGEGPYRFAVDTGASGWGRADASLTTALALPVTRTTETSDGITEATVEMVRLESLELGGLVHRDLDVITRDYSSNAPPDAALSGIIGREFFEDGLLVIDFPAQTLTFSRSAAPLADDGETLAYERPFRIPVRIGDIETEGNLDTGANVTLVFPQSLYERVAASALEVAGQGTLMNTVIEANRGTVHGPIAIGGLSLTDVEVRVSDRYPELLIGGHVLREAVVAIDQRSRRVSLCTGADQ